MNGQVEWDGGEDGADDAALRRLLEKRYGSLEAYHRRLEAEARAWEAAALERMMPAALVLGGLSLAVAIWKSRRR